MKLRLMMTTQVGPYPLDVFEVTGKIDDEDSDGEFDPTTKPARILVHERCKGPERWAVIFHELTHAACYLFAVKVPQEETLCEAVAFVLAETLMPYVGKAPRPFDEEEAPIKKPYRRYLHK